MIGKKIATTFVALLVIGSTGALATHKPGHHEPPSCYPHPQGGPQNKHCEEPEPENSPTPVPVPSPNDDDKVAPPVTPTVTINKNITKKVVREANPAPVTTSEADFTG